MNHMIKVQLLICTALLSATCFAADISEQDKSKTKSKVYYVFNGDGYLQGKIDEDGNFHRLPPPRPTGREYFQVGHVERETLFDPARKCTPGTMLNNWGAWLVMRKCISAHKEKPVEVSK